MEWGENCQKKFNGMWALALWDEKTKCLFISRDRFGEKPLYYFKSNNKFYFASELKAFMFLKRENIPFVVVLTDPTTGGVTASWAMLGDILIAEPKADIGFAGRRVIQDTVRETLPDQFQTAEYVKDHGGIDLVVERKYLNSTIGTLLNVLLKKGESQAKQDSNVTVDKSLQAVS